MSRKKDQDITLFDAIGRGTTAMVVIGAIVALFYNVFVDLPAVITDTRSAAFREEITRITADAEFSKRLLALEERLDKKGKKNE